MAKDMTGAEMVVEALKDQGVEMVFGYPGGAVLPIYDAIFHQNKLRHILVRHEQGAAHAAEVMRARPARSASFSSPQALARPTPLPRSPTRSWTRFRWSASPVRCRPI